MAGLLLPLARALQPAGRRALAGHHQCFRQLSTSPSSDQAVAPQYELQVSIKAYEERYLNQASAAVRDLLFINLAPQGGVPPPPIIAADAAPSACSSSSINKTTSPSPVSLDMPIYHTPIRQNWKRSRFTVIRGPHVHKRGREQFETRKYKVVVRGATHSAQDIHWFLDSIRLYEFPGVQIQVALNSPTYLTPLPAAAAAASGSNTAGSQEDSSLLSEHRRRIARYLMPGRIAAQQLQQGPPGQPGNATSPGAEGVEAALRSLRQVSLVVFAVCSHCETTVFAL